MDEIDLAMRTGQANNQEEPNAVSDPSASLPAELRGMTAVASQAGTIDATIAGKDIKRALEAMDDLDVVDTAVIMVEKDSEDHIKFRYGRNTTAEIEVGAKGVEKASRTPAAKRSSGKSVKIQHPEQSEKANGKRPQNSQDDVEREDRGDHGYASDSDIRPPVRPKSNLRTASYGTTAFQTQNTQNHDSVTSVSFDIPDDLKQNLETEALSFSLEHNPPSSKEETRKVSAMISRIPALPTYYELQTKSNPELAAQLIARSLRVDFVYFMRLTPITAKSPNATPYLNAEVNLELLGSYGLPFPEMAFSPFLHLEALRSELGMLYNNDAGGDGYESDDSIIHARDFYRIGLVVPVWREYPSTSLATSSEAKTSRDSYKTSNRKSLESGGVHTSSTIPNLRETCRKGVVVGVFSKSGQRGTFTTDEREYLKQWVSLRDHL